MERDKHFIIRFTKDEHKRLKLEALERNMSASELVRQAVKIYIETFNIQEEEWNN
jgi:predicted HicB family RNase H-like nuclease